MGLFSFIKEAGEKLLGIGAAEAAPDPEKVAAANAAAADAILAYVRSMNLPTDGIRVSFDAASSAVTVAGTVADQQTKEKILLCCGNVAGVSQVNDQLTVTNPVPDSKFYTVVRGDTLSKIAKEFYGNANAYMQIFEANKPMLSHPDKIYPGQTLRIPPKS